MKLRLVSTFFFLVGFFIFSYGQKSYVWKQSSSGGYAYKYVTNDPSGTRFYTLKNGLSVYLSKNADEKDVAVRIAVRSGSNNDPKDHTGLAHYLEHLLFKGTDKIGTGDWEKEKPLLDRIEQLYEQYNSTRDEAQRKTIYKEIDKVSGEAAKFAVAEEYDKLMIHLGSSSNAYTSVDETVYMEKIPSNSMDKFLAVQAERFRNPIFRLFHTELEIVYEEKNRGLDNDDNKAYEAVMYELFPTHNYGQQTTIGTIEHLKNPSLKAIKEYYQKYYVPNNMAIIMAGDFDPDELIKKIDKAFAYMQPCPVQQYQDPKETPINGPIVKEVYGPSAEQCHIAYRAAAAGSRDAMLASLASSILFNGRAGLIDLNVNKQQKALSAQAWFMQLKDYGRLTLVASPKMNQSLEEVKALLLEQVNQLKRGNFDESLIQAIVARNKTAGVAALESNLNRVAMLSDQFIRNMGTSWNKELALSDEMGKVSKTELVTFARRFFTENNYVLLYKRKGEDKNVLKVEKPAITPVETNAGKTSAFVKSIIETPFPSDKPVWIDFSKEIQRGNVGNAGVLYTQNKTNDLFRLTYHWDIGNYNNKLFSIAGSYLQYLGTGGLSAEAISKQFYNLGCTYKVFLKGTKEVAIEIEGLQENFDKGVRLLENLLRNCKPDQQALETLKSSFLTEKANRKLNKKAIVGYLLSYATYGPLNPATYNLSDQELAALKGEDLTNLLHSLFNYQHRISYYGPQPVKTVISKLQILHTVPAAWTPAPSPVTFKPVEQASNKVLFVNYDAVQSEIYWTRRLHSYGPEQEALVSLFNSYFGAGFGSVVFSTIRESKGLAYSTSASINISGYKDEPVQFNAYVGSQADKMNEAISTMNELLQELPKIEGNFENTRSQLLKDAVIPVPRRYILDEYLSLAKRGVDYNVRQKNYARYQTLKLEDLDRLHQQNLAGKPYTYCIVASDRKINLEDLKKYGELKVLSLEELFGY